MKMGKVESDTIGYRTEQYDGEKWIRLCDAQEAIKANVVENIRLKTMIEAIERLLDMVKK